MRTISELTIFEIADYAALFYLAEGVTPASASLVYHGLNMNFNHVKLLICMFDLFVEKNPSLRGMYSRVYYEIRIPVGRLP